MTDKQISKITEEALEKAFWEFDSLRKRKGRPMAERDAFKSSARGYGAKLLATVFAEALKTKKNR